MYLRGGIPRKISGTAVATGWSRHDFPDGVANFLVFVNNGAVAVEIALSKEDADAGVGWTIAAGKDIAWPAECASIWVKAASSTAAWVAMAFIRRG